MKYDRGFTVIELLITLIVAGAITILFISQRAELSAAIRDSQRKTAINAMYYNLEEVYYEKNDSYPDHIDSKVLRAMDPELFTDPNGVKINNPNAEYRYEPTGCQNNKCTGYTLRAPLEKEAEYTKKQRN